MLVSVLVSLWNFWYWYWYESAYHHRYSCPPRYWYTLYLAFQKAMKNKGRWFYLKNNLKIHRPSNYMQNRLIPRKLLKLSYLICLFYIRCIFCYWKRCQKTLIRRPKGKSLVFGVGYGTNYKWRTFPYNYQDFGFEF